jgi:uncharacterized protein (DUF302 family)
MTVILAPVGAPQNMTRDGGEMSEGSLGFNVRLTKEFDLALELVEAALKDEGFGILTEIDVKATMKKKLDKDVKPYRILGACNPSLAYKALSISPEIGLLLPCNVIVYQEDEGFVEVSLIDPIIMMDMVEIPELEPVATEARERLERVAAALKEV